MGMEDVNEMGEKEGTFSVEGWRGGWGGRQVDGMREREKAKGKGRYEALAMTVRGTDRREC